MDLNDFESLQSVRLNHALVLSCRLPEFERIKEFITKNTDSRLIFEKHSLRFLKIIEENEQPRGDRHV